MGQVAPERLRALLREFNSMGAEPVFLTSCGDTNGLELAGIVRELLTMRQEDPDAPPVVGYHPPPKPF